MSQRPRNKPSIRQVPIRSAGAGNSGGQSNSGGNTSARAGSGSSGSTSSPGSTTKNLSGGAARSPSGGSVKGQPSGGEPTRYMGSGSRSGGSVRSSTGSGRSGGRARYSDDYDDYGRYGPPPPRDYRRMRPRSVQPQRDPFPYIMGGIIGALIVGLGLVVILLLNNSRNNNNNPVAAGSSGTSVAAGAATAASSDPPRMSMADFKALYDDPAKRPLIIDVRTKDTYDAGHIEGAISFPEADVDSRINELPKDKLIVAYCQ